MSGTILVLGSNSFSGAHFVSNALKQNFQVIGISRSAEINPVFLPYKWHNHANQQNFKFFQGDLNHDLEQIMQIITQEQPEYIVNFAAQSMVAESWEYPEHWMLTNVVSNVKLHTQLIKYKNLRKYLHVTTPEVYGSCIGFIAENTNYNPSTPYAVSRAACDMSLSTFAKNYNFPVVFTRAANVFGPGQQLYRIIPKTILSIKLGKTIPLHGGGHAVRSFIHIQDVIAGTLKAMLQSEINKTYHFSTKAIISIRELVEIICRKLGANFEDVVTITAERPGKDTAYLLDSNNARANLGWQDNISLDAGLQETINWINHNFATLKQMPMHYIHKE